MAEVVNNPPASGSGDPLGSFFGFLLPAAESYARIQAETVVATAQANAQAKLNAIHANNASAGPNDPKAAQAEANKTMAQKFLPSYMLFTPQVDTKGNPTGAVSATPVFWALVGLVGIVIAVLIFRRK